MNSRKHHIISNTAILLLITFFQRFMPSLAFNCSRTQVYRFLREEEIPAGKVVLSTFRAIYLAKTYASRGIYNVIMEESVEPIPGFYDTDNLFAIEGKNVFLDIDEKTGLMRTRRRLDFDDPEIQAAGCVLNDSVSSIEVLRQNSAFSKKYSDYCCFFMRVINLKAVDCEDTLDLHVCIEDVNDNQPKWSLEKWNSASLSKGEQDITVDIPENLPVGTSFSLPMATDRDSGLNGRVSYDIWPRRPEFDVIFNSTSTKLCLITKKILDREAESTYTFILIAKDGGIEPQSSTIKVTVDVRDANDNEPEFAKSAYYVTIPEDTATHTRIIQVEASDRDANNNAEVTYSISSLADPDFFHMFSIDPQTGWISTQQRLDFENYKQINLIIGATDNGDPPRQSTCLVEITITDINDNPPKLIFEPGSLTNYALVPENEVAGRVVAVFTVVDEDSGSNGETSCWINSVTKDIPIFNGKHTDVMRGFSPNDKPFGAEEAGDESFFKLELMALPFAKVYQLSTATVFDREAGNKYHVGIACSDMGNPSLNTTGHVLVRIQDVNDNAPKFPAAKFTIHKPENHPVGVPLLVLTAVDMDEGENSTITYRLVSSDDEFNIHNTTGEVTLVHPLDYEKQTLHNFTIFAVDGGNPMLTGSVEVSLYVDDTNDNAPTVTSEALLSVLESHSAADPISVLSATDVDSGLNGNFFFKIISIQPCFCGMQPNSDSEINAGEPLCSWAQESSSKCKTDVVEKMYRLCGQTNIKRSHSWTSKEYRRFIITERGDIYLRYPNLDRETVPVYVIQGSVTDRGQPPQKATFCVTVVVDDVNDCHPKFTFPALTNNTVVVLLPISRGEPLVQLHASDYDVHANGKLQFGFAEGNDNRLTDLFAIHQHSGLMVSKYSLQLSDLEFLGSSVSVLRQTFSVKIQHKENLESWVLKVHDVMKPSVEEHEEHTIALTSINVGFKKVADMGSPPLISQANLRVRFQLRPSQTRTPHFPSLKEQLESLKQQSSQPTQYAADLFDEYGGARTDAIPRKWDRSSWRSSVVFVILCVLFLILLLLLAMLLLIIFTRRTVRPSVPIFPNAAPPNGNTIQGAPMALLISPLHHHQNQNYQHSDSSPTLHLPLTPCHASLPHDLQQASDRSGSGDLSLSSSAV